jgi:uncharacterized damage-inducible protein DinB
VLTSSAVNAHELLIEPIAYLPPARALEGLTSELAERRIEGVTHSIAEIVAHLTFWQAWFIERCEGRRAPMVEQAAAGWPAVSTGEWPAVHRRFLDGLDGAAALGSGDRMAQPVSPCIEFPPLANYTIGDALAHIASHNAHHLGQVVVLRQLLAAWPPPGGSYTW